MDDSLKFTLLDIITIIICYMLHSRRSSIGRPNQGPLPILAFYWPVIAHPASFSKLNTILKYISPKTQT